MAEFDKDFGTQNNVIVAVGIDGAIPENEMLNTIQEAVNMHINSELDIDISRDTVRLTTGRATKDMGEKLGLSAQYVQQYDVRLGDLTTNREIEDAVHNEIVDKLNDLGFIITGTWSKTA